MLLRILQKDLRRKRTMNIILLLFIILATTFLSASVNNMATLTGALEFFMDVAKVPDYIAIVLGEEEETPYDVFLQSSPYVTEYDSQDMYMISDGEIEIVDCASDADRHIYEKGNTLLLEAVPESFTKIFDAEDKPVSLRPGEIALPIQQAALNGLAVGDTLRISIGDNCMEFTVAAIVKDAVFGSSMIGVKRIFIAKDDYRNLMGEAPRYHTMLYAVNCTDVKEMQNELKKQGIESLSALEKPMIKMCYFFNILIAGIMVVVGICLILISFLILRFTIVFTLQEDYKEIGIMKAIGIRDGKVRGIYLLKYFALTLTGSVIGFFLSIPFGRALLLQVTGEMVAAPIGSMIFFNLICAVGVIGVVVLFCYGCTGKVRKYSAIEAIRNGSGVQSAHVARKIRLYKRKRMPACVYLACNDVAGNMKRYVALAVIFCIGTMEILLPLTALHTLQDESVTRMFSVQPSDFYVDTGGAESYLVESDDTLLRADMEEVEERLKQEGLKAHVWVELWYMLPCHGKDADKQITNTTYTMQQIGKEEDDYDVLEGSVPVLDNEVMLTEKTAQDLGVSIGDCVYYQFPDGEKEFIVTGIYQSMMNMGYGMRVSRFAKLPYQMISGMLDFQLQIEGDWEEDEIKERVGKLFPTYRMVNSKEWVGDMVWVMDEIDVLQKFITVIVLIINVLITVLMGKAFITKERGEIAMLKSIGFPDRTIRGWQSVRILLVLLFSIIMGAVLSGLLDSALIGAIFAVMGATSIRLVSNPLETYLLYPALLLVVTGAAAYLCAGQIKKVDVKEINTIE